MLEKDKKFLHHVIMNHLRVRCPSCAKLYEVDVAVISSFSPQFDCVGCHSRFTFEFPPPQPLDVQAVLVQATEQKALEQSKMKSCPKCGAMNKTDALECYSCQIIFERFEKLKSRIEPTVNVQLIEQWQALLQDFANQQLHHDFVADCQKHGALNFALRQYTDLRKLQGSDLDCDRMIAKIETLNFIKKVNQQDQKKVQKKAQLEKLPMTKIERALLWMPFVISFILIVTGLLSRGSRNMIGFGIALAMLSVGLLVMARGQLSLRDFID